MTERAAPETPSSPRAAAPAPPAPTGAPSATRGFLFADLRAYTHYVETHGDVAGAALLDRYRALVRGAVAAASGAEIRTEGDSFYVVFGSVSGAVRCGLAIVGAAASSTEQGRESIRVGVGIHAGETVETADGFVGSAVNIAARLCAEAKAGELVVSETVRGLIRTQIEVEFQPLGARRLKGLAEPVQCYRVVPRHGPAGTHSASIVSPARRTRLLAAIVGAATLAVVLALGYSALSGLPSSSPSAPPAGIAASPGLSSSPGGSAGPDAPSPAASPAIPTPSPTFGPFPTEAEAAILAALPADLASTCRRRATVDDARFAGFVGATRVRGSANWPWSLQPVTPTVIRAGVACRPESGASNLYIIEPWYSGSVWGPSGFAWGEEYLGRLAGRWKIPSGSCEAGGPAHERWHSPAGTGLVACSEYDLHRWIYFTFEDGRYLAFATRADSDYDALYAWWEHLKTFLP